MTKKDNTQVGYKVKEKFKQGSAYKTILNVLNI